MIRQVFFFFLNYGIRYLFYFFKFYLFIYGCVGCSFLCEGFLQLRRAGASLHRGARASHYCGLSCCGAQAPDVQAQQLWLTGPAAPRHVGSSQARARTRVPCISRQILNHCATREAQKTKIYSPHYENIEPSLLQKTLCMLEECLFLFISILFSSAFFKRRESQSLVLTCVSLGLSSMIATRNVSYAAKELNFKFYLFLIN